MPWTPPTMQRFIVGTFPPFRPLILFSLLLSLILLHYLSCYHCLWIWSLLLWFCSHILHNGIFQSLTLVTWVYCVALVDLVDEDNEIPLALFCIILHPNVHTVRCFVSACLSAFRLRLDLLKVTYWQWCHRSLILQIQRVGMNRDNYHYLLGGLVSISVSLISSFV